jgi:hypothetical protein
MDGVFPFSDTADVAITSPVDLAHKENSKREKRGDRWVVIRSQITPVDRGVVQNIFGR